MIPRRLLVVGATFLLYVDRVCISAAKGSIAAELPSVLQGRHGTRAAFIGADFHVAAAAAPN